MSYYSIGRTVVVTREATIRAGCGLLPVGFPFIYVTDTGDIAHEATIFLARTCLGAGGISEYLIVKPATALCRAYDLRDYLSYLHARRYDFTQLRAETLFSYAGTMANRVSLQTKEIYSQLTIARRVTTALAFTVWLGERGSFPAASLVAINALRRDLDQTSGRPFSGRRIRIRGRSTLLPTPMKLHEPRILDDKEARVLLRALRFLSERDTPGPVGQAIGTRNVLMAKVALCAGLRREEICRLEIGAIAAIVPGKAIHALYAVHLTHTKNDVRRKVLFPGTLIEELHAFIEGPRKLIYSEQSRNRHEMCEPVFPRIQRMKKERGGVAMTPQNLGLAIRRAAKHTGLVRVVQKLDPTGKSSKRVEVVSLSTHDLRHTYAVWTYLLLRAKSDTNPWLFIQAQLGHRSSETTINTYLRAVRMFENEISEVLASSVRELTALLEGDRDVAV
ncbi:site-specific integrase [Dyella sp. LX-66]|uniref:tyrosine-type recombinase/integrase n=1 Tax=unclassified Dyella TaxID=2634549 RepID=UPI001BE0BF8A|nr:MULTISPECIES: site-specific integrase [unclassified Dyella]MBT2117783.1 site-specific integrase [Dyella sp. LX-1]MBT2141298.1 site-specific integrase [Dyella sp. LX-66]